MALHDVAERVTELFRLTHIQLHRTPELSMFHLDAGGRSLGPFVDSVSQLPQWVGIAVTGPHWALAVVIVVQPHESASVLLRASYPGPGYIQGCGRVVGTIRSQAVPQHQQLFMLALMYLNIDTWFRTIRDFVCECSVRGGIILAQPADEVTETKPYDEGENQIKPLHCVVPCSN